MPEAANAALFGVEDRSIPPTANRPALAPPFERLRMKNQVVTAAALGALSLALLPTAFGQQTPPANPPANNPAAPAAGDAKAAAPTTEDIVYMRDGRVLHGQIIVETSKAITFEYHDKNLNSKTRLNLKPDEIAEVMRDQPLAGAAPADAPESDAAAAPAMTLAPAADKKVDWKPSYGASRFQSNDQSVKSLYIVPMGGQFGTDVRAEVYKPVLDDIRKNKPSVVVLTIDSADSFPPELMFPTSYDIPKTDPALERGMLDFENYRELVHMFRDELAEYPQIVWIRNSDGISATIAMAWNQMYMTPKARFGGMITVLEQSHAGQWADKDVRAKMMAAWLGIAKSFLEKGGYSLALADAMLNPEKTLSGSWKGREVEWRLDSSGEYLVDDSEKRTVNFVAKTAEDLCISKGTAEDLDDLALLLGFREYRVIDGRQNDLTVGYIEDWRRSFAKCRKNLMDYEKFLSWASGEDAIKYTGRAKSCLEDVLSAMDQYKAVEVRLGTDFGLDRTTLVTYIEQLKEQLRAMQKQGRGAGGGGRAGGGGGRAGGGGGGPGREGP